YLFFLFISLPCSFCPLLYLLSFYHLCLYEHIAPTGPDALVATLADWGAEHRPQEPCSTCGCTLYWTAAGAVMCAICLPMPRLTEESRERIARERCGAPTSRQAVLLCTYLLGHQRDLH